MRSKHLIPYRRIYQMHTKKYLARIDKIKGKHTALKVLSWLFYAQRPMTIDEIREALSIRLSDTKLCAQYFINPVQIIHYCQIRSRNI